MSKPWPHPDQAPISNQSAVNEGRADLVKHGDGGVLTLKVFMYPSHVLSSKLKHNDKN